LKLPRPGFLPALVWLVVVTTLLSLPGTAFPTRNWFSFLWVDKWVHIGLFATLVALICYGLTAKARPRNQMLRLFLIVCVGCTCYGILLEFVQDAFIPRRTFDVWDIAANTAGSISGLLVATRFFLR